VSNKPDPMRRTKLTKYADLGELLRMAPATAGLKVVDIFVILMDEEERDTRCNGDKILFGWLNCQC
jgi:hypothetical protein